MLRAVRSSSRFFSTAAAAPQRVLVLGGGSGCVAQIMVTALLQPGRNVELVTAGRTPFPNQNPANHIHFDIMQPSATTHLATEVKQRWGDAEGPTNIVINCMSTGGKASYDTTLIALLNYRSLEHVANLSRDVNAKLIQMSSLKANFSPGMDPSVYNGPRSPYAWSKLAADLFLSEQASSQRLNVSFIRIGLIRSPEAKKFYQRTRLTTGINLNVTEADVMVNDILAEMKDAETHLTKPEPAKIVNVACTQVPAPEFYKEMSGFSTTFVVPPSVPEFLFGHFLPHKLMDYMRPGSSSDYRIPF